MRNTKFCLLLTCLIFVSGSLHAQYEWRHRACLPSIGRGNIAQFTVGNKGYVVGGFEDVPGTAVNEVWEYDPSTNIWTQKGNYPHVINGLSSFVINDTAYVGLGYDQVSTYYNDFYRYDAAGDQWIPVASFPGPARYTAMQFVINGLAYVGCGFNGGGNNDFYQYDPVANVWTQKANFPGVPRQSGIGGATGGMGIMGLGGIDGGSYSPDIYSYNPTSDTWTQISSYTTTGRSDIGGFVMNDTMYVVAGDNTTLYTDCWRYDIPSNTWIQEANFACIGPPRKIYTGGFVINGHGYVACGRNTTFTYDYNDLLEFGPHDTAFVNRVHVIGNDTSYCGPFSQTLSTGNACTLWSTGVTAAQITVTTIGTYSAYWADTCGMVDDTITISQGTPAHAFGNDTTYCGPFSRVLSSGYASSQWSTGATGAQITVTAPGLYWGTDSNVCGVFTDTIILSQTIAPAPFSLGNDTGYCGPFSQTLSTGVASTEWSTGVTASQITVTTPGQYWAVDSNACGIATDTINIAQSTQPPVFTLGSDTTYCGSFSRILSSGIANTTWSTGATGQQITVTTPGTYTASASNACGITTDSIVLNELSVPQIPLGGDSFICNQQTVLLNATSPNATTYQWQNNSTAPTFVASAVGTYSVTVTNAAGCSSVASVNVMDSLPSPNVDLGGNIKVCGGNGTVLSVPIANAQFVWNDGSTDSTYYVTASGTYSVTVSNGCSSASSEVNVSVYHDDCKILVPTAFSPNGDGMNDIFHAISYCPVSGFSMHVYNRWGEEVYSSTNIQNGWDGTYKNQGAPVAVYVYYIDYMNYCEGKTEQIKGNVTLVR